ncbi:AWPM-19-like protein [Cinnamomum micranthum f. kanehirae]|uniref:AWPM-19-like protein n=1 Tax=Cinnamomum micranthum f. kanehirae TaxID=337451 RepID=A0A3S3QLG2_9MAGN|nr:AWPM-19-like protein [Cinnamomum micranthum f. kanehirae]
MATTTSIASGLLFLNFCMYVIVSAIGGWAINVAIDRGFIIGSELQLPAHFSAIHFPMGNAATGFFVVFSLIAGVVGAASAINGINHIRSSRKESSSSAQSSAIIAWTLTLLAMGLACKEFELQVRNACLRTMEAFTIILSVTQFIYIIVIQAL